METGHFDLLRFSQFATKPRRSCAFQFFHISDTLLCQKRPFLTVAKKALYGAAALIFTGLYPQMALGETIRNKDFLKLENNEKKYWLISTIDTLGFVAGYKNEEQGRCVWEWYYKDSKNKNSVILAYMKKYPEKKPTAILIALTEQACGAYVRVASKTKN